MNMCGWSTDNFITLLLLYPPPDSSRVQSFLRKVWPNNIMLDFLFLLAMHECPKTKFFGCYRLRTLAAYVGTYVRTLMEFLAVTIATRLQES